MKFITMECNKEEAIRAKGIAEKKMQGRDFVGARKIVLKAQQLFPDLENIPQMLTVCEVHCAAGIKVNGETDWYGILQVEPTTDDSTIKKQYRKLAFLLHPDKNKFEGAEAAFKLVGEANRFLSDLSKRAQYDMKRGGFRAASLRQPTQQSNRPSCTKKQPAAAGNAANVKSNFNGLNQQPSPPFSGAQTFWTMCPSCGIRYQYYQSIMNRPLRCQSCMKPFVAYDLKAQTVPPAANPGYSWNRPGVPQQENLGPGAHYAGQKSCFETASGMGFQGKDDGSSTASESCPKSKLSTEHGSGSKNDAEDDGQVNRDAGTGNEMKFEKVKLQVPIKKEQVVTPAVKARQNRRRKIVVESSETLSSDSDVVVEDGNHTGRNFETTGSHPRRSARQKQNISYNENGSDDDFMTAYDDEDDFVSPKLKKLRKGETSYNAERSDKEFFGGGDANGVEVHSGGTARGDKRKGLDVCENLQNRVHEREKKAGKVEEGLIFGVSSKSNTGVDLNTGTLQDLDTITYPDPEFGDFEKERDESKFEPEQIWAVYDEEDGMPRYYARIKHVSRPDVRLKFSWLEYEPTDKAEIDWLKGDLPVGCGSFKIGTSESTRDRLMFSHLMPWRKGKRRNLYEIIPSKGEVWALFKDWNMRWSENADTHRPYEFEVVEVLSDFTQDGEITVVHLVKIQGFVSLFMRAVENGTVSPLKIQANEKLRFSHKIPAYRMTGEEREGIPEGSFELDSASLPTNFSEVYPSINLESAKVRVEMFDTVCGGLNLNPPVTEDKLPTSKNGVDLNEKSIDMEIRNNENGTWKKNDHSSMAQHAAAELENNAEGETGPPKQQVVTEASINSQVPSSNNTSGHHYHASSSSPICEYPEPEFHNFEEWRSKDMFEQGQIWALYSDIDMYPKYYGRIGEVNSDDFEVNVTWLDAFSGRGEEKLWKEGGLPFGCGTFKISPDTSKFDTVDTFSHLVQAKPFGKKDSYAIYPSNGEIWAVFRNWSSGWSLQDLEGCEFDVVEIIAANSSGFRVSVLTKVNGYRTVFKRERKDGDAPVTLIPFGERLRFSHQIPAFRLTEEKGGKLRGCWELDPASVPVVLLFNNSD